jgi:outer membrane protein OmpA-like peptidoglycan-associated protein
MNGIGSERVMARGYGESYPVTTNDTDAGRLQNRRVEIVISHEGQQVAER